MSLIRAIERGRPSEATEPNGQIGAADLAVSATRPQRVVLWPLPLIFSPAGLTSRREGICAANSVVSTESVFDLDFNVTLRQ